MTIKHIALAKFKHTLDSNSREQIFEQLQGLIDTINLVEGYTLGPPLQHPMARNQGWDIALLADFEDLEKYNAYRQHETHLQMMKILQGVTEDLLSYQIEVSPALSSTKKGETQLTRTGGYSGVLYNIASWVVKSMRYRS